MFLGAPTTIDEKHNIHRSGWLLWVLMLFLHFYTWYYMNTSLVLLTKYV